MGIVSVTNGFDWTLPDAPPLRLPPLSLLSLASSLIDVDDSVAARQDALEKLASAEAAVEASAKRLIDAPPEERAAAQLAAEQAQSRMAQLRAWEADFDSPLHDEQKWESGFQWLPELTNAASMEVFVPSSGSTKRTDATQTGFDWYDPFVVVAHDDRSLFGFPHTDFESRAQRAMRALINHEAWRVEREFWTGAQIPTNWHLSASTATATTSPHRTIDAFPNPDAAPTTVLGTAVGLGQSLAALDQAIANADAGIGMIHATPYVVQRWMQLYPYIRDNTGRVFTVNMNLIVPGYGYPGTGPDEAARTVADGVLNSTTTVTSATAAFTASDVGQPISGAGIPAGAVIVSRTNGTTVIISAAATATGSGVSITVGGAGGDSTRSLVQWAYATDMVYLLRGAARTLPWDIRQGAPEVVVNDSIDVRAERSHALLTNRQLRAAVLVDTTTL